jgi:hypothetical protein
MIRTRPARTARREQPAEPLHVDGSDFRPGGTAIAAFVTMRSSGTG